MCKPLFSPNVKEIIAIWATYVKGIITNIPYAKWSHSAPSWVLLPATLGVLLLLSPKGWPTKLVSLALLSPLLFAQQTALEDGALKLSILDVGQGLATVLETEQHILVYDTGPNYSESFNAGEAVIVPYLRHRDVDKVDMLIVSHTDKDHAGGLEGVLTQMQVDRLVTSTAQEFQHNNVGLCREGVTWDWDGVHFEFLHPSDDIHKLSQNNRSCVLLIKHSAGSVLITGDIERPIERNLVENHANMLDTDVLVVPHHGSNSSSTTAFIQTTSPQYAVFATGYRNTYRFPNAKVVSRYEEFGTVLVNTAAQGMITFEFSEQHGLQLHPGYRDERNRFWHSRF